MEKAYQPKEVEDRLYEAWEKEGSFRGKADPDKPAYSIVIPPPNVTGVLTMGHVLNNTIQDLLARRARQKGFGVLWLPGTDHAGIATQTKVEQQLRAEGKSKLELGREGFIEHAKQWRDKHGGIILKQLRKLGCSCDWERTVHTLDPGYSRAVLEAFVRLFENGYVYRGKRMVNWCPASLTALSDEEVVMKPQSGKLYKVRYELIDSPGEYLLVSTTRPETIMGDVALAIHPQDERWPSLQGRKVRRPLQPAEIPIIADRAVDKNFGTGMLKITPAHDRLDFEIGQRHELPVIDLFNPDGTLNESAGPEFCGLDRFDARSKSVEKLRSQGDLLEEENHDNNVGFSERADVPIEPRLSEQWFLRYPRVEEAKRAVEDGFIRYFPDRWSKTYLHWLDNIQDWCISRQLWWGHRIPVWYRKGRSRSDPRNWHVSVDGPSDPENWEQDEDVLDTWASSWLWPIATLGWPDDLMMKEQGLDYFYPTSALVTGPDIIFFWVARMIMAGLEFRGDSIDAKTTLTDEQIRRRIPFRDVYFTGIIRDAKGRKMSKSLGNSPDPLDLIDKYGADGLRHGIMSIAPKGQDIRFSEERIEQGRNFCNKLWNVSRFRRMADEEGVASESTLESIIQRMDSKHLKQDDHAILLRLVQTLDEASRLYDEYEFNATLQSIYRFFWNDLCDWYVENSKARMREGEGKDTCLAVVDLCLRQVLLLLHPVTPFITEELWKVLGYSEGRSIQWTNPGSGKELLAALESWEIRPDPSALEEMLAIRELVTSLRALKAERNLATNNKVEFFYLASDEKSKLLDRYRSSVLNSVGAGSLNRVQEAPAGMPALVTAFGSVYLDLASALDPNAERDRLSKELDHLDRIISSIESKLRNVAFTQKAPAQVVEGAKRQLSNNLAKKREIEEALAALPR